MLYYIHFHHKLLVITIVFLYMQCVCVVGVAACVWRSKDNCVQLFSLSIMTWVLAIKLRSPSLYSKSLYLLSHLFVLLITIKGKHLSEK